jgi:hypothetical protein
VLRSDFQNGGSLNSRVKFSNPMIFAGSGEISRALVKASAKHRPTGMEKKISSRTAGATMAAPVIASPRRRTRLVLPVAVVGVSARGPLVAGVSWVTAMGCSIGGRATPGAGERIRPHPASAEDQAP